MGYWPAPILFKGSSLLEPSIELLRSMKPIFFVKGGWHLSNFHYGNLKLLKYKYDSFSHQELQGAFKNTEDYWDHVAYQGGSDAINTKCRESNEALLPTYVVKRYKRYESLY